MLTICVLGVLSFGELVRRGQAMISAMNEQKTGSMTIEELQNICNKLKGVTQDIKWEHHLCFNVGGKMFLILSPDEVPVNATFKVSDEEFEELSEQPGFRPAPYMARYKWVGLDDIRRLNRKKWEYYIGQSYGLVFEKLPKKEKTKILGT